MSCNAESCVEPSSLVSKRSACRVVRCGCLHGSGGDRGASAVPRTTPRSRRFEPDGPDLTSRALTDLLEEGDDRYVA